MRERPGRGGVRGELQPPLPVPPGWRGRHTGGRGAEERGLAGRAPGGAGRVPAQLRTGPGQGRDRAGREKPWRARDPAGQAPHPDRRPPFSGHIFLLYFCCRENCAFWKRFFFYALSHHSFQQQTRVCKRLWHLDTLFGTSPVLARVLIKQYQQLFGKTEKKGGNKKPLCSMEEVRMTGAPFDRVAIIYSR